MIDLSAVITDIEVLKNRVLYIDGFAFASLANIGNKANVFDAIIIRNPCNAQCFTPKLGSSFRSLKEHVDFVNHHQLRKAIVIAENINFLKDCPSLEYLQIIPADTCDFFDFTPLYDMPNICGLNCATEYGPYLSKHTCVDYANFPHLLDLDIAGRGNLHTNKIPALQRLNVSRNNSQNISDIVSSISLTKLSLTQCRVRSLSGIRYANSLSDLSLWYNRSLFDVSEIAGVSKTLRSLSIEACAKIKDFSFLHKMHNLEHLELNGSNCLPNLSFLSEMKYLTHFVFDMNVEDGDLTPCLSVPYVHCRRSRKHYNLKDMDLPKKMQISSEM